MFDYIHDPQEIYKQSFKAIREETDLEKLPPDIQPVAERIIHASGNIEILDRLVYSEGAGTIGKEALTNGASILVDVEMVKKGIITRRLIANNQIICTLNNPKTPEIAKNIGNTRTAAGLDLWGAHLKDAVVAIGNAPTALFHLLEMIKAGAPRPALILGFPVGFVGAIESKDALIAHAGDIPFITVTGRLGGSAMAAAAVNALSGPNQ